MPDPHRLLGGGWEGVDHEQMRLLLVTHPDLPLEGEGKNTTLLKKGGAQNTTPSSKKRRNNV
ncbi:hypothetical protein AVO51_09010 [Vibrio cholerae]|nr:hypothetical protein AVO51_09010 [Vibrio cholerae]